MSISRLVPFCSRIVAYRLLANGQDCRLQRPETLYSLRQKLPVGVLQWVREETKEGKGGRKDAAEFWVEIKETHKKSGHRE